MNIIEYAKFKKMFGGTSVSGEMNITENGEHDVSQYEKAIVNVPMPSGTVEITENGEYDVTNYEKANVNIANLVIEVDELPTENINANAVYLYNGDLYRRNFGGSWVLNDTMVSNCANTYDYKYISNNKTYGTLICTASRNMRYDDTVVYEVSTGWVDEAYKTITFLTEPIHPGFRSWLEENATQNEESRWRKYTLTTE